MTTPTEKLAETLDAIAAYMKAIGNEFWETDCKTASQALRNPAEIRNATLETAAQECERKFSDLDEPHLRGVVGKFIRSLKTPHPPVGD